MNQLSIRSTLGLLFVMTMSTRMLHAQLPTADLTRIEPRACRVGEEVTINLIGKNLEDLTELRFTHPGITAQRKMRPTDEFFPEPRPDGSKFTITVAKDVSPGIYEVRASGYFGLSTARPFVVAPANSTEVIETGDHSTRDKAMAIEVNTVVTGSVVSRGIDWYHFTATAGQRLLITILAERIDSRLDGLLVLYDELGREVGRNREYFGRDPFLELNAKQDGEFYLAVSDILYRGGAEHFYRLSIADTPHIDFVFPPAGLLGSKQHYSLFGRNLPGSSISRFKDRDGNRLEVVQVEIELADTTPISTVLRSGEPRQTLLPGFDYRIGNSNAVRIGFATTPVIVEVSEAELQEVSIPVEIAGRFDQANDKDVFRFHAEKGKSYCLETIADRMGSKVDPYLILHRITVADDGTETRTQVAENDDLPSFFSIDGKDTINADTIDAALRFTAEDDGVYEVSLGNQFGSGGALELYRLAIREPTFDFQLMATTEHPLPTNRTGFSITPHLRQGTKWAIRILAPRQDGFQGDIVVTAEGLPTGVTARPLVLSGKTDRGVLIVSASNDAPPWSGEIRIVGKSRVDGHQLVHEARFAALVWGHVFADSIRVRSRLTSSVPLSVNGYEQAPVILAAAEEKEWHVKVGETLDVPITVTTAGSRQSDLTVEPFGLFGLLRSPPTVTIAEKDNAGVLTINFKPTGNFKVEPGRYQFALKGVGVTAYRHNLRASERAEKERQRIEAVVKQLSEADTKTLEPDAAKIAKDKLTRAEAAQAEVSRIAKSAKSRSAEKKEKFAVWSDLITVIVEPAE